jgi:hypothetical protein
MATGVQCQFGSDDYPIKSAFDSLTIRPICKEDVEASARVAFAAHSALAARNGIRRNILHLRSRPGS